MLQAQKFYEKNVEKENPHEVKKSGIKKNRTGIRSSSSGYRMESRGFVKTSDYD